MNCPKISENCLSIYCLPTKRPRKLPALLAVNDKNTNIKITSISQIYEHLSCSVQTFDWYTRSWESDPVTGLPMTLRAYIFLAVNLHGTNFRNWQVKKLNFTRSIFTMSISKKLQNDSEVTTKMSFSFTKRHKCGEGERRKCVKVYYLKYCFVKKM